MLQYKYNMDDMRHAMCQWSDDFTTDRQYGDARWGRLSKKVDAMANDWTMSEDESLEDWPEDRFEEA